MVRSTNARKATGGPGFNATLVLLGRACESVARLDEVPCLWALGPGRRKGQALSILCFCSIVAIAGLL